MAEFIVGNSLRKLAREHRFLQRLLWRLDYALVWLVAWLARRLPIDTASRLGGRVGAWVGANLQRKTTIFRANLAVAFPAMGNAELDQLVERAWIQAYSPYQNLRAGQPYPEVFIHTSTKDDRVHPGHARKAAARLEELGYPVLFYENTDGGHAAGANLRETARRIALEYTYLSRRLMD